jgi:hypothetical protein
LLKQFLKDATNFAPRFPFDCEPNKKRAHVCPSRISSFFSIANKFKKDDEIQVGFLEALMLFMIKELMPMRTIVSIWLQTLAYMLCMWLVFHSKRLLLERFYRAWLKKP